MSECSSSSPLSTNGAAHCVLDAEKTLGSIKQISKPPLSPLSIDRSQTHAFSVALQTPSQASPSIGAVASLAITGGISKEELLLLGQNRPPPISIRSTRAAAVTARGGGARFGPRRNHHTAPPGTVQIGRPTRVTRCDICLSPPSSALCSVNPSPRGSPLYLTRVGGIATDSNNRKASLPTLSTDRLVRVGPGNAVSTRGQSYARINLYPKPYKSDSSKAFFTSSSPPTIQAISNVPSSTSTISPLLPMFSTTNDKIDGSDPVSTSPDEHWNSSAEVPAENSNFSSCPTSSASREAVHFFGSSYTAATTTTTATTATLNDDKRYASNRSDATYQQRLYHRHIARGVRSLRRYKHIYGDSMPSSEERVKSKESIHITQPRRSSAEGVLTGLSSCQAAEPVSPSSPTSSVKSLSEVEKRSRHCHISASQRLMHNELQGQTLQSIPVINVIVQLENAENTKPSVPTWLHRKCFVHNGYIYLISPTKSVTSAIHTTPKPSAGLQSLREGIWCQVLANCHLTWADVTTTESRLIGNCGLQQSIPLHAFYCLLRTRNELTGDQCSSWRMYFLLPDQRSKALVADLKDLLSETSNTPKAAVDANRTGFGSRLNSSPNSRGASLGVAGPPGGFPLMVAAETLAASFGVHMNRNQTVSLDSATSKGPISLKKSDLETHKTGISSAPLQSPLQESSTPTSCIGSSQHKSSLLRSTFARMRHAATGGSSVNSSSSAANANASTSTYPYVVPSTNTVTSSRSAFHQRLAHLSQTFTHDKSSPRRHKLDLIHRNYQSCQTPHLSDVANDQESSRHPNESRIKMYAQFHLPLTAVLEPSNSLLQTINDELIVNANELEVTMPMQLAVVDAAMVAANGGTSSCVEAAGEDVEGTRKIEKGDGAGLVESVTMHHPHHPGDHSTAKALQPSSSTRSVSVSSGPMNTSHSTKELNSQTVRRLLRRPTDPTMNIDADLGDFHEAILLDPPILYPERSLVGSLPLHQCARSTFSAFVPFVVELCVTLVEKFGLNCVGIYRVSGNKLAHDFMAAELCKQLAEIDAFNEKWNDIHALACVLKTLLRNLPDSLIPKAMYPEFLSASRVESWERRLLSVQRLLSIMECYPKHPEYRVHRATLRYLATHLARVASRQAVNRMTAYNLALVFAPNVIQSNEDSPELFIADSKFKIWLLETIIKYHKWVFSPDLGLESGCFVPEDSDKVLLTDEALAEAMAATSSGTSEGLEFANQPGRSEGDVRPVLQEMLHAAALLPPPSSTSDLEVAEEPGPSLDKPTDVTTVVEQALESSAVEYQEAQQQQHQQRQRNRPVSQPGRENRSHKHERSLSVGRRREEQPAFLITSESFCRDVEREDPSSARMPHPLLTHLPTTAPPSPRISSFNQPNNSSTTTTDKAATSTRWRPFHRQRRHSGDETDGIKSTIEMAVVEAGEEIYSIGRLVAFRRAKSCRRRHENDSEVTEAFTESTDLTTQELEQSQRFRREPIPPPSSSEAPTRVRHHSLRKWWFH